MFVISAKFVALHRSDPKVTKAAVVFSRTQWMNKLDPSLIRTPWIIHANIVGKDEYSVKMSCKDYK